MLLLLSACLPVQGQQEQDDSALQALLAILADTQSLQAELEQLFMDQDGREVEQARARLALRKPDHFYWEITEPYQYLLLTDGQTIWQYEADLEQVSIDNFSGELESSPLAILNGSEASIAATWDVGLESPARGLQRFTLRPRSNTSLYTSLGITFEEGSLQEMYWQTTQGQRTRLFFIDVENNPELDEELFHFEIPAGVDVIDSRPD